MSVFKNKNIVLGITGSIAAYKTPHIIRLLRERGAHVFPVMTRAATYFVHPTTYQSIAAEKVTLSLFGEKDKGLRHISLSRTADLLLIAPATANIIGKIAAGIADDILTTTVMATRAPVVIAPAMDDRMYENPLVQRNIRKLKSSGYRFIGPEEGKLASGEEGKGRMSEPAVIVKFVEKTLLYREDLKGKSFIVTAGPTREPVDSIRFISNYSSGKMGFAIAEEARDRGAKVILISGPTCIEYPWGVELHRVETAHQMLEKVRKYFTQVDGLIMAAAVADFYSSPIPQGKLKKEGREKLNLQLIRTPDILEEMRKTDSRKILVGFCAETENLLQEAKKKLKSKKLDLIAANDLTEKGAGFGTDTNKVTLVDRQDKIIPLPLMSKRKVAEKIIDEIKKILERNEKRE